MRNIVTIFLVSAFLFLTLPSVVGFDDDSIEIEVTAGQQNRQIGFGIITLHIVNSKPENITVKYDYYFDCVYGMAIPNFIFENTTVGPLESKDIIIHVKEGIGDGWYPIILYNFHIEVTVEYVQFDKKGLCYRQFVVLWDPIRP